MNKKYKKIKFLSDLEGTLINENGGFDEEHFYNFVSELSNLADILETNIDISILSPMGPTYIKRVLDKMDRSIHLCSQRKKQYHNVNIDTVVVDGNDSNANDIYIRDKRIFPMFSVKTMKLDYTRELTGNINNDQYLFIYVGNGDNDVSAMGIVKKLPNGITICPHNSTNKVKKQAIIKSSYTGVVGVTDGIRTIINGYQKANGIDLDSLDTQINKNDQ